MCLKMGPPASSWHSGGCDEEPGPERMVVAQDARGQVQRGCLFQGALPKVTVLGTFAVLLRGLAPYFSQQRLAPMIGFRQPPSLGLMLALFGHFAELKPGQLMADVISSPQAVV
jgi:hypothetical protein